VRGIVEVAFGIGRIQVDCRRHVIAGGGHGRRNRLNAAGAAEQVTGHGFGRADSDLAGAIAECLLDGAGFGGVVAGGAGAVGVDVADLLGGNTAVFEG